MANSYLGLAEQRQPAKQKSARREQRKFTFKEFSAGAITINPNQAEYKQDLQRNGFFEERCHHIVRFEAMKLRICDTAQCSKKVHISIGSSIGFPRLHH